LTGERCVPSTWRLNPAADLHWRLLDDQWVVFESAAGGTHQLDALHAAVLMALETGRPMDMAALLSQVQTDLDQPTLTVAHLAPALEQLAQLDLLLSADRHNPAHAAASPATG
jgi:PqqD family protein of HPr-rel-A system